MDLTGQQQDAVTEILNRAVQHVASALAEVIGEQVRLSIAFADMTSREAVARRLDSHARARPAVAVRQRFNGSFSGQALLVFCERQSMHLVRFLLADMVPLDAMTDLEQDMLTELGNVMLNACLGSLTTQLCGRLTSTLPDYRHGAAAILLEAARVMRCSYILMLPWNSRPSTAI